MSIETGTPSDELPEVLALGRSDIGLAVVSLSARHPDGRDADYLEWHSLDHRPEQHRLAGLRGAERLVSTPACRAARAAGVAPFATVDHVMIYLFAEGSDLGPFFALGAALHAGGRMPLRLPAVELGVYEHTGAVAAPRIGAGADVLPWRPARGAYLLIERGTAPVDHLAAVDGVAGAWWFSGTDVAPYPPADTSGRRFTWLLLDDDPVAVADRLRPTLDARWGAGDVEPLLAAPFHTVVPFEWARHLP